MSPIEREVLWMLEEAGEENLLSVFNTLCSRFPNIPDDGLIHQAIYAVQQLQNLCFIDIETHREPLDDQGVREALAKYRETWVDMALGLWSWDVNKGHLYPEFLVLTE